MKISKKNVYDFIIVGTGIAGLNAARYIPKDKKVLFICKNSPWECNTFLAQGGVAVSRDIKDIDIHIQDTLKAGCYHNKKEAVEVLAKNSKEVIEDLIQSGFNFDKVDGKLAYTKEAAHSTNRILHADGDATGRELHMFLLKQCQHEIISDAIVTDLFIENDICYGVQIRMGKKQKRFFANYIILASGGIGSIYKYHTNSTTIAGEIQGICIEKGIKLKDMEFMQFHPTVFIKSNTARKVLLSEALRGEGAVIEDENGYRFLKDYHKDKELAPRDVVSRAIFDYKQKTNLEVYLSFKNFSKKFFKSRFPNIYANLKSFGFDLPFERVPISPAFHYSMGGIEVDLDSKVVGFKNLYAIGEVSYTGVHGANRLASNSLLEALVFSKLAVNKMLKDNFKIDKDIKIKKQYYDLKKKNDKIIKNELRELMWNNVGIVKNKEQLVTTLEKINKFLKKDIGRLLYLRLLTAKYIVESSIENNTSIGAHYIV